MRSIIVLFFILIWGSVFLGCKSGKHLGSDSHTQIIVHDKQVPVFRPADSASIRALLECDSNGRVMLSDNYAGYDHAVKLLRLQNVLTKEVETLTPETEEEFGNDPVFIYKGDITISGGYMNIFFMQNLPSSTDNKHRISLVRPQEDDALYGEDGYVHLELRYNDYDDLTGRRSPGAVSYNLNSLDIPSETKGIKLKLNSEENGEVEVTFDLKTAGSNEKLTTNVDLSNMQLK